MVERVAVALYVSAISPVQGTADEWDSTVDELKDHFRNHARVAFAAMREPTRAMEDAAISGHWEDTSPYTVWLAMINEALK